MKRIYVIFFCACFLIVGSLYRLWEIQQPRTGPIGDGTIPTWVYVSIYSALASGISGLLLGIVRYREYKKRNKDTE